MQPSDFNPVSSSSSSSSSSSISATGKRKETASQVFETTAEKKPRPESPALNERVTAMSSDQEIDPRLTFIQGTAIQSIPVNPLFDAIRRKDTEALINSLAGEGKFLFRNRDTQNKNIFHIAAMSGSVEIFNILYKFASHYVSYDWRSDLLNGQDIFGNTPLSFANLLSSRLTYCFLQSGANPEIMNGRGVSVLSRNSELGHALFYYHLYAISNNENNYWIISQHMGQLSQRLLASPQSSPALRSLAYIWNMHGQYGLGALHSLFSPVLIVCSDGLVKIPQIFVDVLKMKSQKFRDACDDKEVLESGIVKGHGAGNNREPIVFDKIDTESFEMLLEILFAPKANSRLMIHQLVHKMVNGVFIDLLFDEQLIRDQEGKNILHRFVIAKNLNGFLKILEHINRADPQDFFGKCRRAALNIFDHSEKTPLHYAENDPAFVVPLLKAGADPRYKMTNSSLLQVAGDQYNFIFLSMYYKHLLESKDDFLDEMEVYVNNILADLRESPEETVPPAILCLAWIWEAFKDKHNGLRTLFQDVTIGCNDGEAVIPKIFVEVLKHKSPAFLKSFGEGYPLSDIDLESFKKVIESLFSGKTFVALNSHLMLKQLGSPPILYELLMDELLQFEKADNGRNIFHVAAINNDVRACKSFLGCLENPTTFFHERRLKALNKPDVHGLRPLEYAMKSSDQLAALYISIGADTYKGRNVELNKNILAICRNYIQLSKQEKKQTRETLIEILESIAKAPEKYSPGHAGMANAWMKLSGDPKNAAKTLFANYTFSCTDGPFVIPKIIVEALREKSPYFRGLLEGNFKENVHPDSISLSCMKVQNFEMIIKLLFAEDNCFREFDNALEIISIIDYLQLRELIKGSCSFLKMACEEYFSSDELTKPEAFANIAEIHRFADALQLDQIKAVILEFIEKRSNCSLLNKHFKEDFSRFQSSIELMREVPIRNLDFSGGYLTDNVLEELNKIPTLSELNFVDCEIQLSNSAIEKLRTGELLPNLKIFSFVSLQHLEIFDQLMSIQRFRFQVGDHLNLSMVKINFKHGHTEALIHSLARYLDHPALTHLDFDEGLLTTRKFRAICKIKALKNLTFYGTSVKLDSSFLNLLRLQEIPNGLNKLEFIDCFISAQTLRELKKIEHFKIIITNPKRPKNK